MHIFGVIIYKMTPKQQLKLKMLNGEKWDDVEV